MWTSPARDRTDIDDRVTERSDGGLRMPGRPARHLTLSELWAMVAVTIAVVALLLPKLSTIDLAYQIRAGEVMLRTHRLLDTDVFSFTSAGRPWLNQQWGAQVVLALLHRAGGWPLLVLMRATMAGAIAWLVYLACRSRGAVTKPAAWLTMAAFAVWLPGAILRPQLFGLLLFAATGWLVADRDRHPERLWWIPVLALLWANLHGSFFLAPVLVGLAWLRANHDRSPVRRRLAVVGVLAALAANLNPFGLRIWRYAVGIPMNKVIADSIVEWRPPTVRTGPGLVFFLSVAAVILMLARRGGRTPWPSLASLGLFFLIGLLALRGIFWWAVAAPPVVADLLPDRLRRRLPSDARSSVNTALGAMVVLLAVLFLPWWRAGGSRDSVALLDHAPPGVTSSLASILRPGERVFVGELWGSWIEWRFPGNPVFVDSRIEVFPPGVWRQYDQVSAGVDGWQEILRRWRVDVVVASRSQQGALIRAIRGAPGWSLVHEDGDGVVLERSDRGP